MLVGTIAGVINSSDTQHIVLYAETLRYML